VYVYFLPLNTFEVAGIAGYAGAYPAYPVDPPLLGSYYDPRPKGGGVYKPPHLSDWRLAAFRLNSPFDSLVIFVVVQSSSSSLTCRPPHRSTSAASPWQRRLLSLTVPTSLTGTPRRRRRPAGPRARWGFDLLTQARVMLASAIC
jgi:hypothetical protein